MSTVFCKRCRKQRLFLPGEYCGRCREILSRMKKGLCLAVLHHGPGHQSMAYCDQTVTKHRMRGRWKRHSTVYGNFDRRAEWFGTEKFTGYFDEPPSVEEPR